MKESSAFIFHSHMKGLKSSMVENTVLHVINSRQRKIESQVRAGCGIGEFEDDVQTTGLRDVT